MTSDGTVLASDTCKHAVSRTPDGIVSINAPIWFEEFATLAAKLLGSIDVRVVGIGVSGMGPCVALTDSSDVPVAEAALYGVDARARTEIEELTQRFGAESLLEASDSCLTTQAAGPKFAWFYRHFPQLRERESRFYMPASYVVKQLTGEYVLARQCTPVYHATLMGAPLAVRHNIEVMEQSGLHIDRIACAGGGLTADLGVDVLDQKALAER